MDLLIANHDRVYAQIGLITVDQTVTDVFEPRAAKPQDRLAQAKILVDAGIYTAARIDPIIPGVTDTPERLKALFAGLASAGIKKVAASYLFTRPSISRELESVVGTNENVRTMFREFESGTKELELHCKSKVCFFEKTNLASSKNCKDDVPNRRASRPRIRAHQRDRRRVRDNGIRVQVQEHRYRRRLHLQHRRTSHSQTRS